MRTTSPAAPCSAHIWASIAVTIVLGIICCGIYPLLIWGIGQAAFRWQADGSLLDKYGNHTTDDTQAVGSALIGQNFSAAQYFHPRPSAAGAGYDATSSGGTNLGPLSDKLINGLNNAATTQPTTQPESITYDGVRFRTIHYAYTNGLSFKLYNVAADGTKTEVPLKNYQNKDGTLNQMAMVDAFPHNGATAGLIAGDFKDASGNDVLIPGDAVTASGSGLDPHISPANAALQVNRVAAARKMSPDQVKELVAKYTDGPDLGILGDPGVNVLRLNIALDNQNDPHPNPLPEYRERG